MLTVMVVALWKKKPRSHMVGNELWRRGSCAFCNARHCFLLKGPPSQLFSMVLSCDADDCCDALVVRFDMLLRLEVVSRSVLVWIACLWMWS